MPRAFDITAVTDTVRLNATGQGEVAYTVSNALRAPVRARASIVPGPGAKAEWATISGGDERDFAPDGTQQLSVQLRVPPGTPPGRFTFHLLVVDVTNPDERYAEGPATAFEVVAAPPPKKPFPWMWVALAAGVILIIGTVIGIISSSGGAELGQPCPGGDCDKGLTCTDPDGGSCLVSAGEACDGGAMCSTGFCNRRGECQLALGQTCASQRDCPGPLKCTEVPGSRLCLLESLQDCERDSDCSSFYCRADGKCSRDDGRCESNADCRQPAQCGPTKLCQLADGQPCRSNEVCLSGFCAGTCQVAPLGFQCPGPCPDFTVCSNGQCVNVRATVLNQEMLQVSPRKSEIMEQMQEQQRLQLEMRRREEGIIR
ncbi:hypothetical protein FJV41_35315 [Myxococcus llanfairpwllgwyngyllgogerychwyrndrobwllllantysiliogogogochensis]|uniref:Uncharacterized protein n=1 Tax=Myxococcus llanfairpwllgwyngyllgogerychwyrndrobwllllantysiliogogogochensis TaxID=2590453 RepID=A0A540WS71_9BACT|nr:MULTISPECIES: hypothetical protein [Myxococcus]NTX11836.1 hypothetical protein [Myxococcus sp. CA056]TQF11244.1 hypothetical protein FJV41_35315 [Myxococcus llanfairpwllgwyngyllgogerychwyrndrobwllllantysiliogogogochensis]